MRDIVIGIIVIALCLGSTTALVLHGRRAVERISRLKSSTYRDILKDRDG